MLDIVTTTATAGGIFLVAGAGVAVLPFTKRELAESRAAFAALVSLARTFVVGPAGSRGIEPRTAGG